MARSLIPGDFVIIPAACPNTSGILAATRLEEGRIKYYVYFGEAAKQLSAWADEEDLALHSCEDTDRSIDTPLGGSVDVHMLPTKHSRRDCCQRVAAASLQLSPKGFKNFPHLEHTLASPQRLVGSMAQFVYLFVVNSNGLAYPVRYDLVRPNVPEQICGGYRDIEAMRQLHVRSDLKQMTMRIFAQGHLPTSNDIQEWSRNALRA